MIRWHWVWGIGAALALFGSPALPAQETAGSIRQIVVLAPADAARFKRSPGFYEVSSWTAWADPCARTSEELEKYLKGLNVREVKLRGPDNTASEESFWEAAAHLLHADLVVYRGREAGGRWEFERLSRR